MRTYIHIHTGFNVYDVIRHKNVVVLTLDAVEYLHKFLQTHGVEGEKDLDTFLEPEEYQEQEQKSV